MGIFKKRIKMIKKGLTVINILLGVTFIFIGFSLFSVQEAVFGFLFLLFGLTLLVVAWISSNAVRKREKKEVKCFHEWNGCKCRKCLATRDEGHNWLVIEGKCKEKCTICGKERSEHKWNGCKCEKCGAIRDKEHTWIWNGKCKICGTIRDENTKKGIAKTTAPQETKSTRIDKTVNQSLKKGGNIHFIACICQDQPNIINLKFALQNYIVNKEQSEGNTITTQTLFQMDSYANYQQINDKSYLNERLKHMYFWGFGAAGEELQSLINRSVYKGSINEVNGTKVSAKFFVLYE